MHSISSRFPCVRVFHILLRFWIFILFVLSACARPLVVGSSARRSSRAMFRSPRDVPQSARGAAPTATGGPVRGAGRVDAARLRAPAGGFCAPRVERRIRETRIGVKVRATLMRQLERIQHILMRTWAERLRMAANHRGRGRCCGGRGRRCRQQLEEGAFVVGASYKEEERRAAPHITHICM